MRTSNPVLSKRAFEKVGYFELTDNDLMSVNGTINKALLMLLFVLAGAGLTWNFFFNPAKVQLVVPLMIGGAILGFITAIIISLKPTLAKSLSLFYALFEGAFIGGLSAFLENLYPGIVIQAVALTFGVVLGMLILYRSGIIKVTNKFRMGVFAATGGIALYYLFTIVLGFFGFRGSLVYSTSTFGIIFSLFVVGIAALNLVLDFDFIVQASANGAPKFMEWYAAFGLMVTLIWLYIEILRLLSKFSRK